MSTKVGVVSLGCDKNRVDTEIMLSELVNGGFVITPNPREADVIIVNTCAFLESARREAIETALEMSGYKDHGKCKKVIITGCLGEKFGEEVFNELNEVDAVLGINDYHNICNVVNSALNGERKFYHTCSDEVAFGSRILTTAPHVAYLKIADGCDNYCTYCLIPYIRGRYRSVKMEKVVAQAKELADKGVKELILVAQDTTRYGKDLYGEYKLTELIRKLSSIKQIEWIRILYAYPELLNDELLDEIVRNDKVVKYVDIPLQHVNDEILRKMNRRSNGASIRNLFDKLSSLNIYARSTFICGFPFETNATIEEVERFLFAYKLRNVGFFPYSREEGTAAAKYDNQVSQREKNKYVEKLYNAQYRVLTELNQKDVGRVYKCVIDEYDNFDGEYYFYKGRTYFMSPEIDGTVHITSKKELITGNFYNVKITGAAEYDLLGEAENELTE